MDNLGYRVRQIEDALDVLLFDPQRTPGPAHRRGFAELLREGKRLLEDVDAIANRVRRVATGWEPQLTHVGGRRDLAAPPCWSWWRPSTPMQPAHAPEAGATAS
jgi:DNA-binding transcriptional LysR family regulator